MILNLGVSDIPYVGPASKRQKKRNVTTGDVATILEAHYGVMQAFVDAHGKDVMEPAFERSLGGAFDAMVQRVQHGGGGSSILNFDPFAQAMSEIEDGFKQFIGSGEIEQLGLPGVPTQAALDRRSGKKRSSRFKRKRAMPDTPSFYDSGLYMGSFKAWMEN